MLLLENNLFDALLAFFLVAASEDDFFSLPARW